MTSFLSSPCVMRVCVCVCVCVCVFPMQSIEWERRAQQRCSEMWTSKNADKKSFLRLNFTISQTRLPSGTGTTGHPVLPWSYIAFLPAQPAWVKLCQSRIFCGVARWLISALQKQNLANEVELFELLPLSSEMLTHLSSSMHFNFETPMGLFSSSESPSLCLPLP